MNKNIARTWLLTALLIGAGACAAPIVPTDDAQVIETLPANSARAEQRALRQRLAAQPDNPALAAASARQLLAQAREQGDPRYAGQALALLQRWPDATQAPAEVLLMQATVQQFLHDFDGAAALLDHLLQRQPHDAQAWLTLATLRRVQGRYDDSDKACRQVAASGAALHATACLAENQGLRGHTDIARASFAALLGSPRLDPATRGWLSTSLAELEARAARPAQAEAAYRAALQADADAYAVMSFADFLIDQQRPAEALVLLKSQPRTDAVLLRLAIAGQRTAAPTAAADVREMRERIALANQRPGAQVFHAREQAMFALWVEAQPAQALALARLNIHQQREPLDVLVLAQAARRSGQKEALAEAARQRDQIGLRDARVDALL